MTYFITPVVAETLWNMLVNRKIVRHNMPGKSAIPLAIAIAVIAYKFADEQ